MAHMGPAAGSGLRCGNCSSRVAGTDLLCPSCGAHLVTGLCERCGHRGPREEFRFNRCPACGHRADIGATLAGPLLVAGALVAFLALAFFMGR